MLPCPRAVVAAARAHHEDAAARPVRLPLHHGGPAAHPRPPAARRPQPNIAAAAPTVLDGCQDEQGRSPPRHATQWIPVPLYRYTANLIFRFLLPDSWSTSAAPARQSNSSTAVAGETERWRAATVRSNSGSRGGLTAARSVTKAVVLSSLVSACKGVSYPAAIEPPPSPTSLKGHLAFDHGSPDFALQHRRRCLAQQQGKERILSRFIAKVTPSKERRSS